MKNKLKKALKLGILFFGISLLLWNCQHEEEFQNLNSASPQTDFTLASFVDAFNQEKRELLVHWEEYNATEDEKATYKEYTSTGWEKPHLKTTVLETTLKDSKEVRFEVLRYAKIDDTEINQAVCLKTPFEFSGLVHYQNLAGKITKITIYDQGTNLSTPSFLKNEKNSSRKSEETYDYYKDWSLPWERIEDDLPRYRENYDVLKQTVYFNYFSTSNYQGEQWNYLYTSTKPFIRLVLTRKSYSDTRATTFTEETLYKNIAVGADRAYRSFLDFPSESPFLANAPAPLKRIISNKIGKKLKRNLGLSVQQKRWINRTLRDPDDTQFKHLTALYSVLKDIDFFKGGKNAHKEKIKKIAKKIVHGIKNKHVYSLDEYFNDSELGTLFMTKAMKKRPKKLNRVLGIYDIFREDMVLPWSVSDYHVYSGIKEQAIIEGFIRAIFEESTAIIFNELTGKAKCIYDKLQSSSTGFKNAIQKFDGEFPVSHLSFKINNTLSSGNYGITNPPNNFNTTIEFSNTQLSNISDLGGAVAFAHEMIHAEIFRKMLSAAKQGHLNLGQYTTQNRIEYMNSLRNNFPGLYDYYWKRYHPTWNHNLMAQHYRSTIAVIAQQFDDNAQERQVYEDIAWAGLRILENGINSIAWDNLSTTEQQRILTNLSNFFHNGTNECN